MPSFAFVIEVDTVPVLIRKFATAGKQIDDFTPMWPQVRSWFQKSVSDTFQAEGRPSWAALKPGTVKQREKLGFGGEHPILVRTGELRNSFFPGGSGHVDIATPHSIELGSSLKTPSGSHTLALIHQRGAPKANIPARPMLKPIRNDLASLRAIIAKYVHDAITGAGQ